MLSGAAWRHRYEPEIGADNSRLLYGIALKHYLIKFRQDPQDGISKQM